MGVGIGAQKIGISAAGQTVEVDTQQAVGLASKAAKAATLEKGKALYDFPGQQAGDLQFREGDLIEIVSKGQTILLILLSLSRCLSGPEDVVAELWCAGEASERTGGKPTGVEGPLMF